MIVDLHQVADFSDERVTIKLLQDTDELRLLLFCLRAGQQVAPHTSECHVHMLCCSGEGSILVGEREVSVRAGTLVYCPPRERHGFTAQEDMTVLAMISPSPSSARKK